VVVFASLKSGYGLMKSNFREMILLSLSRFLVGLGLVVLALALMAPYAFIQNPLRAEAFDLAYGFAVVSLAVASVPFIMFPVTYGAVALASKKEAGIRSAFTFVWKNYLSLFVNSLLFVLPSLFFGILGFLAYSVFEPAGILLILVSLFFFIRLFFWDVFLVMGRKNPLRDSWEMTGKNMLPASSFIFTLFFISLALGGVSSGIGLFLPQASQIFDMAAGIIVLPFSAGAKVFFAKNLNKTRA
jgi:hypothetical protein